MGGESDGKTLNDVFEFDCLTGTLTNRSHELNPVGFSDEKFFMTQVKSYPSYQVSGSRVYFMSKVFSNAKNKWVDQAYIYDHTNVSVMTVMKKQEDLAFLDFDGKQVLKVSY